MPLCKIIACAVFYKIGVHTISGPYWFIYDTIAIYFTSTTIITKLSRSRQLSIVIAWNFVIETFLFILSARTCFSRQKPSEFVFHKARASFRHLISNLKAQRILIIMTNCPFLYRKKFHIITFDHTELFQCATRQMRFCLAVKILLLYQVPQSRNRNTHHLAKAAASLPATKPEVRANVKAEMVPSM